MILMLVLEEWLWRPIMAIILCRAHLVMIGHINRILPGDVSLMVIFIIQIRSWCLRIIQLRIVSSDVGRLLPILFRGTIVLPPAVVVMWIQIVRPDCMMFTRVDRTMTRRVITVDACLMVFVRTWRWRLLLPMVVRRRSIGITHIFKMMAVWWLLTS